MVKTNKQAKQGQSDLLQNYVLQKTPTLELSLYLQLPAKARWVDFLSSDYAFTIDTR